MRCAACGFANAETARFCGSCGERLTAACPHCGAHTASGLRFCTTCGGALPASPLSQESTSAGGDELPAERRRVSVLFADLVDFTALAESLDPEEVRALQGRYFETAREAIVRYGGTVEKFIGDAVMAVWGAPRANEDDPERAVRAALDLVDAVGRIGAAGRDRRLRARAAVMTGEAAVTPGAVGQGLVSGDLVNTAGRLQAAAEGGTVLVDGVTRRAATGASYEPAGAFTLKGKAAPVEAWRAIGVSKQEVRAEGRSHAGPLVDREAVLTELDALLRGVVREGRGRLVSIMGPAGIGKSRVVWELERRVEASAEGIAWHFGRAPAYGDGVTFAALAQMVRQRARIEEGMGPEVGRRQLSASLAELVRDEEERRWLEPRLAVLVDPREEETFEREELFAAWRRYFERVSQLAPAVMVFDDLHWADASLLEFIEHLAAWTRRHPILIVVLAREELLERHPGWGSGLHTSTVLHLDGLPDADVRALLRSLVADLPDAAAEPILDRAGGVPLYVIEMVRMLADQGRLVPQERVLRATGPIDRVELPDSLRGLIAARIDLLPPAERSLLMAGAVLGGRFRLDALSAVTALDPAVVREHAAALVRRELLGMEEVLPASRGAELVFLQDPVREVAASTLSRRERASLHLRAASYLEQLGDSELVEAIAWHLTEAHAALPGSGEAGELKLRAREALRGAAHRAMLLHAPARALSYLEQALELGGGADERAPILEAAAAAARSATRFDEAERFLGQLVALHQEQGSAAEAARARAQLASLLLIVQRNEPALENLEASLAALGPLEVEPAGVELAGQLARAKMIVGQDREAIGWADRTVSAADSRGLTALAVDARITRGTARVHAGARAEGLAELRQALDVAVEHRLLSAELRVRNNLTWLTVTDDPRSTFETARAGMELASEMGIGDWALQFADLATTVSVSTGDWGWALATIRELEEAGGLAASHRIDFAVTRSILAALTEGSPQVDLDALELDEQTDPQLAAGLDDARAWAAFVSGRYADAADAAQRAAARLLPEERHHSLTLAARARLWSGDASALRQAVEALAAVPVAGREVEATRFTLRAGSAALDGRVEEARGKYDEAVGRWRELDLPLDLALCLLERGRFLDDADARGEAVALLERLGARGLLGLAGTATVAG